MQKTYGKIEASKKKGVKNHMNKDKEIRLSEEEQIYLKSIVKSGTHPAKEIIRARVSCKMDAQAIGGESR